MKLNINTIIVDDVPLFAEVIKKAVLEMNDISSFATYTPIVFSKGNLFEHVSNYIQECINNKNTIDLIFADYNLGGGKNGIELLKLFDDAPIRPFKVFHSITDDSIAKNAHKYRREFDDASTSKELSDIWTSLCLHDAEIVRIKLFGNPFFYDKNYENERSFVAKQDANRLVDEFRLIDILWIETYNRDHYITYRKFEDNKLIIKDKIHFTGNQYSQDAIRDLASDLSFARINKNLTVNLLWASEIDRNSKCVRFISSDSRKRTVPISNFSNKPEYKNAYNEYLPKLSANLHTYFT